MNRAIEEVVTSRMGRVSRNHGFYGTYFEAVVTSRMGRVSRNLDDAGRVSDLVESRPAWDV